ETTIEIQLEIGHVLFIDIVGYSKLFITELSEQLQTLKEIVRATEQFRSAEAAGKLMRMSTGDRGGVVFRTSADELTLRAIEIATGNGDANRADSSHVRSETGCAITRMDCRSCHRCGSCRHVGSLHVIVSGRPDSTAFCNRTRTSSNS